MRTLDMTLRFIVAYLASNAGVFVISFVVYMVSAFKAAIRMNDPMLTFRFNEWLDGNGTKTEKFKAVNYVMMMLRIITYGGYKMLWLLDKFYTFVEKEENRLHREEG